MKQNTAFLNNDERKEFSIINLSFFKQRNESN